MDIKIDKNRIQLADISAFTNRTLYLVPDSKDSVTFIFSENLRQTVIVKETTVNGIQMTATNIDELLVDLFFLDNSKVEALDIEIKRLEDKLDVIVGMDDPNGVIDKWNEIIQFLNGIDEDETLLSILLDQKQKLRSESSELFSNSISNCMNLIKASYDILVTDTAMLASDKANLTKAYTAYQLKAETLVTAITSATDTEKTTDSELNFLKTAASDYSTAVLIYKTIEEQVRQNIIKTKASIIHSDINLLVNSTIKKEAYVSYETGEFLYAFAHQATDYINASVYNQITISNTLNKPFSNARIGFYDQNKVFLSGSFLGASYPNKGTVDIPEKTYYLVFSYDVKMLGVPFSTVMIQSGSVATNKSLSPEDIQNELQRIDNSKIGGRNYVLDSKSLLRTAITNTFTFLSLNLSENLLPNTEYILSIGKSEILSGTNVTGFTVLSYNTSTNKGGGNNITFPLSTDKKYVTFKTGALPDNGYTLLLYTGIAGSSQNRSMRWTEVKLEKGNKATDWTSAPEDIQTQIQKIENLMVAGRNIIPNTASITTQNIAGQASNETITTDMIQGKTYTLSYESTTLAVANNYPQFYIWSLNDWNSLQTLGTVEAKVRTFVWNKPTGAYTFTVYNHNYPQSGTITKLKLERGTTATNWTPAPEDL